MAELSPDVSIAAAAPRRRRAAIGGVDLWVPLGLLIVIVGACFFGGPIGHLPGVNAGDLSQANLPVGSSGHLLGTDQLGNDLLSRCLYGGQISIEVGFGSVLLGLAVGGTLGMIAGYLGGVSDIITMRIFDIFLAFPGLILALAVAAYLGPNERDEIFAIAFFTVPSYARLARSGAMRLRDREFMVSARLMGGRSRYIAFRHVLPNVAASMLTYGLLMVAVAMVIEAVLSFLGLGVRPPAPSWGNMIASGEQYMASAPQTVLVPSAFLFVTVLALNFLGESLRTRWTRG